MPRETDETLASLRRDLRANYLPDEAATVAGLIETVALSEPDRQAISERAADLVRAVRGSADPRLMEVFLSAYGLSTKEGVALMCLAEALLRVPDAETMDDLIRDKIAPHDWSAHSGGSSSIFVNASTWALMLTGRVLDEGDGGVEGTLRAMVRRLGEPVIRTAVAAAMREMGEQFVLGRTIDEAVQPGPPLRPARLSLLLRHAGRGGPHRGRRAALSPRLCRRHRGAEAPCERRRHPPATRASRSSSRRSIRATSAPGATPCCR